MTQPLRSIPGADRMQAVVKAAERGMSHDFRQSISHLGDSFGLDEREVSASVRLRQYARTRHNRGVEPSRGRSHRVHRRGGSRPSAAQSGASEEHASQSHSQSLRLCWRHLILLGQEWLHPWAARRRLRRHHSPTGPKTMRNLLDNLEEAGGFQSSSGHECVFGQSLRCVEL